MPPRECAEAGCRRLVRLITVHISRITRNVIPMLHQ
jgi:hypothetical protein